MNNRSRKKFLFSGLSLAAIAAFFKWGNLPGKQPEKRKTAKFLTQEGKLVEIDLDKLPPSRKAATKDDVRNWIKK